MVVATSVHCRPPLTSVGVGFGSEPLAPPSPRTPNQPIPQQYMSPVVMMPQEKPPVVVSAPCNVPPATAMRVKPTTRAVGVAGEGAPPPGARALKILPPV